MAKAKKKTAKKAAKKVAKKATSKKKAAKKVTSKKKVAKKATTKKKVTKKVTSKKKVAKKVVSKKKVTKKVTSKKKAAKKVAKKVAKKTSKKVTSKKQAAKSVAKKTATKKEASKKNIEKVAQPKVVAQKKAEEVKVEKKIIEENIDLEFDLDTASLSAVEAKVHDEINILAESLSWDEIAGAISTLDFFVDHRSDDCGEKGCDNLRTTQNYCRLHYVANWYDIKKKREILKEGKLQDYIQELVSKYPPKLIESIVDDLQDDKDFYKALSELNIMSEVDLADEEFDGSEEDDDADDDIAVETRNFTAAQRYEDE